MKTIIELNVNDELFELVVEPRTTLLEVLRECLALTGTKEACGTGECGACTVLIDEKPKLACLILAVECANKRITTVEGLARDGQLTPVQQAFLEKGAVQCGFCTSRDGSHHHSIAQRKPGSYSIRDQEGSGR